MHSGSEATPMPNLPNMPSLPPQPSLSPHSVLLQSRHLNISPSPPPLTSLAPLQPRHHIRLDTAPHLRTRALILSNRTNPWFFYGSAGEGIGGPHVGLDAIWPMSIIIRAMTSISDTEIVDCLRTLRQANKLPN